MLRKCQRHWEEQEEQGEMAKEQVTFQTGLSDCSGGCWCQAGRKPQPCGHHWARGVGREDSCICDAI